MTCVLCAYPCGFTTAPFMTWFYTIFFPIPLLLFILTLCVGKASFTTCSQGEKLEDLTQEKSHKMAISVSKWLLAG